MLTGKELKIKRITIDIKAIEVASHLGVNKSYISLMENCRQNIPLHIYEKWIKFLGIK